MRKSTGATIAAATLVALTGVGLTLPATSAAASPSGPAHDGQVLHLTSTTAQFAVIDVGDKGPALGLGDQIVSSDEVFRQGRHAGRSGTVLTVVGVSTTALTTQWLTTLELDRGQLVLQGIGDGPLGPPTVPVAFTVAVTGGTGAYADARGVAEIIDRPGGVEDLTIRIDR